MATYLTFTTLSSQLAAYIERGGSSADPVVQAQIPYAINGAERKLIQALKLLGQIEFLVDPTGLQTGRAIITKPDRWRQTVSMTYGAGTAKNNRRILFPRSYEYCRTYWPDETATDANNPPKYYSDTNLQHWLISPTPDQVYPLEAVCYLQPPLLDANNQTNFWTIWTPNAILYGALLELAPFLKSDERLPIWDGLWKQELAALGAQDLQRQMDREAKRGSAA